MDDSALNGFLFHLSEQFDDSMVLESINFLRVLASREPLAILDKHVDAAFFDKEFQVEGSVALRDGCIVQHCLTLTVPPSQVNLVA